MADISLEDLKARLGQQSVGSRSLAEMRATLDAAGSKTRLPPDVQVVATRAAGCAAEWLVPGRPRDGDAILYVHGGAFVAGSCQSHRSLAAHVAVASRMRTLLLEYRLAPEHPWPAAEHDILSALRWLYLQGLPPARVTMVGDSAGGNLGVAALLRAKNSGPPLPRSLVLLSPWLDLRLEGASVRANADADPILSRERLAGFAALYLNGQPGTAILDSDVSGLPRTLIQAGGDEILLSDSSRFAARLHRAAVDVSLEVGPGLFHVWHAYAPWLKEARAALERIGAFLDSEPGMP